MKKAEFLLEVKAELDNIKVNATKEEIGKLDMNTFIHTDYDACIYGQMTGYCSSNRAKEIYPKLYLEIGVGYSDYRPFTRQNMHIGSDFTPLEKYLYMVKKPMHKTIIAYLKGDIQEIVLK